MSSGSIGGTLQMNNSQLTGNDADGGVGGGLPSHATATLNNVSATGNSAGIGGGIVNLNLQGSAGGNTASVAGGGIANFSSFGAPFGSITLHNTEVTNNSPNNPASARRRGLGVFSAAVLAWLRRFVSMAVGIL